MAAKKAPKLVEKAWPTPVAYVPPTPRQQAASSMQMEREMTRDDRRRRAVPLIRERLQGGGLDDDPTESGEPVRNPKVFGKGE